MKNKLDYRKIRFSADGRILYNREYVIGVHQLDGEYVHGTIIDVDGAKHSRNTIRGAFKDYVVNNFGEEILFNKIN